MTTTITTKCTHDGTVRLAVLVMRAGNRRYRDQCGRCGMPLRLHTLRSLPAARRATAVPYDPTLPQAARRIRYRDFYDRYLESPEWHALRDRVLARAGGTCELCRRPATAAHHRTYERLGAERIEDLMAVCRACHDLIHSTLLEPRRRSRRR